MIPLVWLLAFYFLTSGAQPSLLQAHCRDESLQPDITLLKTKLVPKVYLTKWSLAKWCTNNEVYTKTTDPINNK